MWLKKDDGYTSLIIKLFMGNTLVTLLFMGKYWYISLKVLLFMGKLWYISLIIFWSWVNLSKLYYCSCMGKILRQLNSPKNI